MTTKEINLNIWRRNNVVVSANQGESDSRFLKVTFKNNKLKFNLLNKEVNFHCVKPDGTVIYNSCTIEDSQNGIISLKLTSQMSAIPGILLCEFHIISESQEVLKVVGLEIVIVKCFNTSDSIESFSEFTRLTQALTDVKDLNEKYNSLIASASEIIPIDKGGTGASTAIEALENLGLPIDFGSWTPKLESRSGNNPEYTTGYNYACYYSIGKLVYISFHLKCDISNAGSDYACITGLPFAVANNCDIYALAVRELHSMLTLVPGTASFQSGTSSIFLAGTDGSFANQWKVGPGYIGASGFYIKV